MSTKKTDILDLFSQRLNTFMEDKSLTLKQLADLTDVPASSIDGYRKGVQAPYLFIYGMSKAFPHDIHYLLTGTQPDVMHVDKDEREALEILRTLPPLSRKPLIDFIKAQQIQKKRD